MGGVTILFDGRDVQVTADLKPASTVMISFSWAQANGLANNRLGDRFIESSPTFAGIFFVAKRLNWYQTHEMPGAIAAARAAASSYAGRVVIGASMGGYGALAY